jgi:drug/metabolite transporter (DMT)-like permease
MAVGGGGRSVGAGAKADVAAFDPIATEALRRARWQGVIGLLCTVAIWGATIPAITVLAPRWDPYFLAMIRYVVAAPVFWVLLKAFDGAGREAAPVAPLQLLALGLAMAAFALLYTLGIAYSHPVTAVIFGASMPIVASLVARLVDGTVPSAGLYLGMALVVPGAAFAMLDEGKLDQSLGVGGGEAMIVIAMVAWSWYSIMAQRWFKGASQVRITAMSSFAASVFLVGAYGLAGLAGATYGAWSDIRALDVGLIAILSYGVIVIAVVLWNHGVARLGLSLASLYLNLIPAVTLAILSLMEIPPTLGQVAGAALVVGGILLAQRWPTLARRR